MNGTSTSSKESGQGGTNPGCNPMNATNLTGNEQEKKDGAPTLPAMDSTPNTPPVMLLSLLGSTHFSTFRTNIFQLPGVPAKFFYEPVVFINPSSVRRVLSSRKKVQHQVRFVVQMWDKEVEKNVVEWLKSYLGEEAKKITVQVVPYDEVRLVQKQTAEEGTFRLPDHPTTYYQLKESLAFYLYCNSKEEAEQLVADIKTDPESWMDQNLELECLGTKFQKSFLLGSNGLTTDGSLSSLRPVQQRFCLNVVEDDAGKEDSEDQEDEKLENRLDDLKSDVQDFQSNFKMYLRTTKKDSFLFSARRDADYEVGQQGYITYQEERPVDPTLRDTYGSFDINTGIFKAACTGLYLFDFHAKASCTAEISLNVNNISINTASTQPFWGVIYLRELADMRAGDSASVVITKGKLRFSNRGAIANDNADSDGSPFTCTFSGYFVGS